MAGLSDIIDVAGGEKPILVEVDTTTIDQYFKENAVWIVLALFLLLVVAFVVGALVARKLS